MDFLQIVIRTVASILIGGLIGIERLNHGRAAGMRTHMLVCLGSALTAMTSLYVIQTYNLSGDVFRISAQVISGIGFIGAGTIILKNNNVVSGLTTAAGVWTVGIIGIAIGYGFYYGALFVAIMYILCITLVAKVEKSKKLSKIIYVEIDDMYHANEIAELIKNEIGEELKYEFISPKSGCNGNLGLTFIVKKPIKFDSVNICNIDHVVFTTEERSQ